MTAAMGAGMCTIYLSTNCRVTRDFVMYQRHDMVNTTFLIKTCMDLVQKYEIRELY